MLLRVLVNVGDQLNQVSVGGNVNAAKRALKQGPGALIGLIEGAGVSVEQIGEGLAEI